MSWDCGLDPSTGVFPRSLLRLKVSFEYAPPEAAGERLCWLALEPSRCRVVADLACLIRQRFGLGRRVGLSLFVQGCLLPPAEPVGLVRDGDTVHVRQTDSLHSLPSDGEDQTLPSSKKRKTRHGEGDSDVSDSAHSNVKKHKKRKKQEAEPAKDEEEPQEKTRNSLSPAKKRRRKKADEVDDGNVDAGKAVGTSKGKRTSGKLKKSQQQPASSSNEEDEDGGGPARKDPPKKVVQKNKVSPESEARAPANGQKDKSKVSNSQQIGSALLTKHGKGTALKTAVSKKSKVAVTVSEPTSEKSSSSTSGDDEDDGVQGDKSACGSKAAQNKTSGAGRARGGKGRRQVAEDSTLATAQIPVQQKAVKPVVESDSSSDSDESDDGKKLKSCHNAAGRSHSGKKSAAAPAAAAKKGIASQSLEGNSSSESDSSSSSNDLTLKKVESSVEMTPVNALGRTSAQENGLPSETVHGARETKSALGGGQRKRNGTGNRGTGRGQGKFCSTPFPKRQENETHGTAKDEPFRRSGRGWRSGWSRGAAGDSAAESRSHLRFDDFTPDPETFPGEELSRENGACDTYTNVYDTYTNVSAVVQNPVEVIRRDYSALPTLDGPPRAGDHIAFKMLEMNENYSPVVSDYKEGQVLRYDPISRDLDIKVKFNPSAGKRTGGKFELEFESEAEAKDDDTSLAEASLCVTEEMMITMQWTSLIEPRLIVEVVPPASVALP